MKKLFAPLLVGLLLVMPLATLRAADLTKNDVRNLAPNLLQALSLLSNFLGQEQALEQTENLKLNSDEQRLLAISGRLGQYNLSQSDLDSMFLEVGSIGNEIVNVNKRRVTFQSNLTSISQVLAGIISAISSAV